MAGFFQGGNTTGFSEIWPLGNKYCETRHRLLATTSPSRVFRVGMSRYLVDITRTISRIDRGQATGIDRVEMAYIQFVLNHNADNIFFARLGRHSVLFNVPMVRDILRKISQSNKWGWPGFSDAIRLKLTWEQRCARSYLKRNCLAIARSGDPAKLFQQLDLAGYEFLNVGHSNLTKPVFRALKAGGCPRIRVFVHDMIPLDYPEFSKSGIPKSFEKRMRAVAGFADQIICNSEETSRRVQHYFREWGAKPDCLVVHLGIEPMSSQQASEAIVKKPYFVVLGTIEPRKNHLLLFRVWERMAAVTKEEEMPCLYVVGRRGWSNESVFQFLDKSMLVGKCIFEKNGLDDTSLSNLLDHANALLFPSFVEGFGLPALEAAQIGVPVICSDLHTFREVLGEAAIYLDPNSPEDWQKVIEKATLQPENLIPKDAAVPKIPTWESHFRHVFG